MKKAIYILSIITYISGTVLLSCQSKKEERQQASTEAQHDTTVQNITTQKPKIATAQEWEDFKNEINTKIDSNKTRIADLKIKIKKSGKSLDTVYSKNIQELEKRNQELKMRITDYKNDSENDWETFKGKLNDEVNKLDQSIENLKNKKK